MPAITPRWVQLERGAEATSSVTNTVSTRMSSMSAISAAMSKFMVSPE